MAAFRNQIYTKMQGFFYSTKLILSKINDSKLYNLDNFLVTRSTTKLVDSFVVLNILYNVPFQHF